MHEGVEAAREQLLGSQYRLVFREARRLAWQARRPDLEEDLFHVGVEALFEALDGFDPSRAALSTYTVVVAERAIRRFVRKESRYQLAEDVLAGSNGGSGRPPGDGDEKSPYDGDAISRLEDASDPEAELVARLMVLLPDDEAMILEAEVNQIPQEDLAEALGISTRTVRRKRDSARRKLRAYAQRFGTHATPAA
jgi:RNA polymerase sigma factor (sigma-70 family)